jgi:hypothetical protein
MSELHIVLRLVTRIFWMDECLDAGGQSAKAVLSIRGCFVATVFAQSRVIVAR